MRQFWQKNTVRGLAVMAMAGALLGCTNVDSTPPQLNAEAQAKVICDKNSGFVDFEKCLREVYPEGSQAFLLHDFLRTEKFGNYGSALGKDNKKYTDYRWDSRSLSNYKLLIKIYENAEGKLIWDVDPLEFLKLKQIHEQNLKRKKDMFFRSSPGGKLLKACNIDPDIYTLSEFQEIAYKCILENSPVGSNPEYTDSNSLMLYVFSLGFNNLDGPDKRVFNWIYTPNPIYKLKIRVAVNETNKITELKLIK